MVKLFASNFRFAPERLSAVGFAEFHAIASNSTEEGRGLNRRIDIVVLQPADARISLRCEGPSIQSAE